MSGWWDREGMNADSPAAHAHAAAQAEADMRRERDAALALAAQWATRRLAAQSAIRLWVMNADAAMADCDELRAELDRYRAHHERCGHGCELHYEEQS